MSATTRDPAREALRLLREEMMLADLEQLDATERSQFAAILEHWLALSASVSRRGDLAASSGAAAAIGGGEA